MLTSVDIVRDFLVLAATLRSSARPARLTSVALRKEIKKVEEGQLLISSSTEGRRFPKLTLIFLLIEREGRRKVSGCGREDDETRDREGGRGKTNLYRQ